MNKIVREHYPVANLPEDLRKEFAGVETVRVVAEEKEPLTGAAAVAEMERRYQEHWKEIAARKPFDVSLYRGTVTIEEAVAQVRALRDEWDDE